MFANQTSVFIQKFQIPIGFTPNLNDIEKLK